MTIKVGIIQASYGTDPDRNIEKTRKILDENYRDADVIILPEYSMINVLELSPKEVYMLAEDIINSAYLKNLSKISSNLGAYIIAHFIERTNASIKPLSTSVLIKPDGSWEKLYSKIHLFDAYGYRESDYFTPGDSLSKEITFRDAKIRIAICFDIRFPELFRIYAVNDANIIMIHSGWVRGLLKEETLEFLARTRAHENTVWVVISDHFGEKYVGRSMVIDPYGIKALDLGIGEKYIEYEIDPGMVFEARKQIPVIKKSKEVWSITLRTRA